MRQPSYDVGLTARLVLAEAAPDHEHQQARLAPTLVLRESTGPAFVRPVRGAGPRQP